MAFLLAGFFGVVFCANAALVIAARHSWSGLVVGNSYVASQNFDSLTSQLEASRMFGLHASVSYRAGEVFVTVVDAAMQPAFLDHPVLEAGDARDEAGLRHELIPVSPGVWRTHVSLTPGHWAGFLRGTMPGRGEWVAAVAIQVKP